MYKNILTAVDGSPQSAAVLETVASLAGLTGATVHVVHIRPSQVVAGGLAGGAVVPLEGDADGRQIVDEALSALRKDGITATGEVDEGMRGELAAVLVERAESLGSDLVAVGPGHYSGITALLHASVSRGVAKASPVSVLLVRGEA